MFEFVLNGHVVRVPGPAPDMTLLDYLRSGPAALSTTSASSTLGADAIMSTLVNR